jgi:hypothetical protein
MSHVNCEEFHEIYFTTRIIIKRCQESAANEHLRNDWSLFRSDTKYGGCRVAVTACIHTTAKHTDSARTLEARALQPHSRQSQRELTRCSMLQLACCQGAAARTNIQQARFTQGRALRATDIDAFICLLFRPICFPEQRMVHSSFLKFYNFR